MLLNLRPTKGPLYRRIYHAVKTGIRSGRFGATARLPSTRALAIDLGVSRNTVILAYEQLAAEGYIVSRQRSAVLVVGARQTPTLNAPGPQKAQATAHLSKYAKRLLLKSNAPSSSSYATRPGLRYDFRYGRPAFDEFPRDIWRQLLAARLRKSRRESFGYAPPAGYAPLREALTDYLKRARGLSCEADQIIIVNGSQQALDLIARILIDPGDRVVIEEPHYPGATLTFKAAGARIISVPVDEQGLDVTKLPSARTRVRLVSVTPCHQFPTGVIMPLDRRLALLNWAARSGAWIAEDDYISEFRYEGHPLEALQALDRNGQVLYIGTFSKTLFPSLRLAYLVLPRPLVAPFLSAKWIADRYSTILSQEALTDFIATGKFELYLRRASLRNARRRQVLIETLRQCFGERVEIAGENAGVHLLVWLNGVAPTDVSTIIEKAARAGVGLYSTEPYYTQPTRRAGLLFGYAALSETEIRAGIQRLRQIL
jgi:GntR family transcriptional regulator / MocR family aminotransferase